MRVSFAAGIGYSLAFYCAIAAPIAAAAPLSAAKVTEVHNEVGMRKNGATERPAAVNDTLIGKDILRTGKRSMAELQFSDQSITRLGSNSTFTFDPTSRTLSLQRGSALIHVPPGLNGAKIITPTASAAILGDVIAMRVDDRGATQVVALSKDERGPIRVTFNKTGESRTLKAGEMLTVDPNDSRLRDPTPINVEVFTHTSGLIQNFKTPLTPTAQSEILATQHEQAQDMQNGEYENQKSAPDSGSSNQTTSPATVQATVGSNFAGTYTGQLKDLPPCSPQTSQMTVTFQPDGTFSGTTTKISGTDSFTGQMKADGTFTVYTSNGSVVHGAAQIGSNTISGRGNDGVCDSVFTVKK